MAKSAITAPWSVLREYKYTYEPPRSISNAVAFTSVAHDRVYEGLDILANSVSIVLNHRTVFRDCRIRFLLTAGITGNANCDGSEFENCLFEYMVTPTTLNSLNAGWVALKFTDADYIRLKNTTVKGSVAALSLTNCIDFGSSQFRVENLFNASNDSMGNMLKASNCPGLNFGNFTCINSLTASYTGDLISLSGCDGAHIYNGILDGNNAPTGAGIRLATSDDCLIENVDLTHMSDSAVDIDSGDNNHLRNVRTRDNNGVGKGGRAAPTNGGWAFRNAGSHTVYEQCVYDNLYTSANILDNTGSVLFQDIQNKEFVVGVD